jgi:hypothetical protein
VEAAIARIAVFCLALRAESKARHRRIRPVIWHGSIKV